MDFFNPHGYTYAGIDTSASEHGCYSYENYAPSGDYYGVPVQPGVSFPLVTITPPPPMATDNFWQSVHDVEFLRKVNDFRRLGLAVKVDDCTKIEHTPPHLRGRLILPVEWRQHGAFTAAGGWSGPMIASLTGAFTAFPSLDVHQASLACGSGHAVEAHLFGTMEALERSAHIVRAWAPLVMVVPIPDGIQTDFLDPGREDLRTIESLCHVVISVHNTSFLSVGAPVGGLSDLVGAIWKLCELMDASNSHALLANSRMDIILPERYCNCLAVELEAVAASTQTSILVLSDDPDAVETLLDVTAEASSGDNATTSPSKSDEAAAADEGVKKEREAGATAGSARAVPKLADASILDCSSIVNDEKIVRIVGSPEGVLQARKLLTEAMPVILELSVKSDFVFDLTVLQKYDALNKIRLNGVYDSFEGPNERTISFCTQERELSVLLNIGREMIAQAWPDEQEPRAGTGGAHHQPPREFVPAPPLIKRGLNPDAQEFRPMGFREPENLVQPSRFQPTVSSVPTSADQQRVGVQEQLRTSHCDAEAHGQNDASVVEGGLRTRVRSGRRRNSQRLRRTSEVERNDSTGDALEKEGLEKLQKRISECEVFFDKKAARTTGKQGFTSSSQQVDWSRASSLRPQPALVHPARNREPQRPALRSSLHHARAENCRPYSSLFPSYQQPHQAPTVPSHDLDGSNGSPTRSLRRTSESLAAHPALARAAEKPSVERTIELKEKSTSGLVPTPGKNAEAVVKVPVPDPILIDSAAVVPKTELPARSNENAASNVKNGKTETAAKATPGPLPRCWATEVEELEKLSRDAEKRKSTSASTENTEERAEAAPKVITVPAGPVLLQRNKPAVALPLDFEEVKKGKKKNGKGRKGKKGAGESPGKSEKETVSNEQIILDTYGDSTDEDAEESQTPAAEVVTPKKEASTVTSSLAEASNDEDKKDLSRLGAAAAVPSSPPQTAVFSYKAALSRDPEQARAERAARDQAVREKALEEEKAKQEEEKKQRCEEEERKKKQLAEEEHGKHKLMQKKDDKRREDRGSVRKPRRVEVQRYDARRNHVPRRREEESEYGKIKLLRKGEALPGAEVSKKQEANRDVPKRQEEAGIPKSNEKKEVPEPEKTATPVTPANKIPVTKSYAAALLRSSDSSNGKGGNVQQMAPSGVSGDVGKDSTRKSAGGNTLLANAIKNAIFTETPRRRQQSLPRRGAPTGTRPPLRGDGINGNPPRSSRPGTSNASAPLSTVNGRNYRGMAADNSKSRQQQQVGDRGQREGGRTRGSPDVKRAPMNDKEQQKPSAAGAGSPPQTTEAARLGPAPDKPSVTVKPAAISEKTAAVPAKKKLRGGADAGSARRA